MDAAISQRYLLKLLVYDQQFPTKVHFGAFLREHNQQPVRVLSATVRDLRTLD